MASANCGTDREDRRPARGDSRSAAWTAVDPAANIDLPDNKASRASRTCRPHVEQVDKRLGETNDARGHVVRIVLLAGYSLFVHKPLTKRRSHRIAALEQPHTGINLRRMTLQPMRMRMPAALDDKLSSSS